nr:hypothetical protein [uncultured Desulfobacter sp.]
MNIKMKNIARALIYATTYINLRDEDCDEQSDVDALESIAGYLSECTAEEIVLLKSIAKEMALEEKKSFNREDFVRDYENWVEEIGIE